MSCGQCLPKEARTFPGGPKSSSFGKDVVVVTIPPHEPARTEEKHANEVETSHGKLIPQELMVKIKRHPHQWA
jgi:predicted PilT family ATPase